MTKYYTLQIKQESGTHIGNVDFYFYIHFGDNQYPLAMVTMFSLPDPDVFAASSEMVYLCEQLAP